MSSGSQSKLAPFRLHALLPAPYRSDPTYVRTLLRWAAAGLLARLLLMPFTLSFDLAFLNAFAALLPERGVWELFSYLRDNYAQSIAEQAWTYYSPHIYYTLGTYDALVSALVPGFEHWMGASRDIYTHGLGNLQHYALAAGDTPLLRAIWLLKLPYLLADAAIGLLLLRVTRDRAASLRAFKLWMANPATLYATFVYGQFEIVDAAFLVAALVAARRARPGLAMLLLGVAASFKQVPLLPLLPLGALLLAPDWKGRVRLLLIGLLPHLALTVPTILASGGYSLTSFVNLLASFLHVAGTGTVGLQPPSRLGLALTALFLAGYAVLVLDALLRRRQPAVGAQFLSVHWALTLQLLFAAIFIEFHHFTWLSPLLVLLAAQRPALIPVYIAQVLSLVPWTFSPGWSWWGLLAPLGPDFFPALPTPEALLTPLLPWGYLARAGRYVWIALSLATAAALAWQLLPVPWATRARTIWAAVRGQLAPPLTGRSTRHPREPHPGRAAAFLRSATAAAGLSAVACLVALAAVLAALHPGEYLDIHQYNPPRQFTNPLGQSTVTQSFVPSFDRLGAVEVYLTVEPGSRQALVTFELRDDHGKLLAASEHGSETLQQGYHRFSFDPVAQSAGREFTLGLTATPAVGADAVRAGMARSSVSHTRTRGNLLLDTIPADTDLAFQTLHAGQTDLHAAFAEVRRRVAADGVFLTAYGALLLIVFGTWLVALRRRSPVVLD